MCPEEKIMKKINLMFAAFAVAGILAFAPHDAIHAEGESADTAATETVEVEEIPAAVSTDAMIASVEDADEVSDADEAIVPEETEVSSDDALLIEDENVSEDTTIEADEETEAVSTETELSAENSAEVATEVAEPAAVEAVAEVAEPVVAEPATVETEISAEAAPAVCGGRVWQSRSDGSRTAGSRRL